MSTLASPHRCYSPGVYIASIALAAILLDSPVAGLAQSPADLELRPESLSFLSTQTGSSSAPLAFSIGNNTKNTINGLTLAVSGDFKFKSTCGASLPAGASCQASVTFAPSTSALRTGQLSISYAGQKTPSAVALSGNAYSLISIAVSPQSNSLPIGAAKQFHAVGSFSDGSVQEISSSVAWSSADQTKLTVNKSGFATGVAAGSVQIMAASRGVAGTAPISVTTATLVSLAVDTTRLFLPQGFAQQFNALGTYSDGTVLVLTPQVAWTSSVPTVAAVNPTGLVSTLQQGTAFVKASLGSINSSANLTVTSVTLKSVAISPSNLSMAKSTVLQLQATGAYSDGSTRSLTSLATWSTSASKIAGVTSIGRVIGGPHPGSATLSAAFAGISANSAVTVTSAVLSSIAVTPGTPTIPAPAQVKFTAKGSFSDGSTQDVSLLVHWSSSAPGFAVVSNTRQSEGLGNALAPGVAVISGSFVPSIAGTASLTVNTATLVSLAITPANPVVPDGGAVQFTAIGKFSDNSTQPLTQAVIWSSSNSKSAVLSNVIGSRGFGFGLAPGKTTVKAALGAVSGATSFSVASPKLISITVTPPTAAVIAGKTQQFTASGAYSDGTSQDLTTKVTWSSSQPPIATVSNSPGTDGLATGVSAGTSTISATLGTISGTALLTVTAAQLLSISVTPANPSAVAGSSVQFTATGTYTDNSTQDLTTTATWSSSSSAAATISNASGSQGLAQAVAAGPSTITASLGTISGATTMTVTAPPPTLISISITPSLATIFAGSSQQFTATGSYSDGTTQDLTTTATWSASSASVATVSQGLAQAAGPGSAQITASVGSISGSSTLNVASLLISIVVTPPTASVPVGGSEQFTATGTYSDSTTQDLTAIADWTASPATVATVTAGLAQSIAIGPATVTASSAGVSGTAALTVTPALVSITVTPATVTLLTGATQQFTATGNYSDSSTQDLTAQVTWSVSPTTVASISPAGLAQAVAPGLASITAILGSTSGSAQITVTTPGPTLISVAVSPQTASVFVGASQQFTATGTFSDASLKDLTATVLWSASPGSISVIGNAAGTQGLATGIASGPATITAALNGLTGSATLTVNGGPTINITAPANLSFLNISPTTVNGTVSDNSATVNVNGIATPVSNGAFSVSIPLQEGNNTLTATAQNSGGIASSSSILVTLDTMPPRVTINSPTPGLTTTDASVNVSGTVNDIVVGTVNNQQVTVTVNGAPAQVANRSFLLNSVPLVLGSNLITVIGTDRAGNSFPTSVTATRNAPAALPQIQLLSGNSQTGAVSAALASPLTVALIDGSGQPVPNVNVVFKVAQNNGMVQSGSAAAASVILVPTDAQGHAQATWKLGTHSGAGSDMVQAYSVNYQGAAVFSATALQSTPALIVVDSGNSQVGAVNQPLPLPMVAVATDAGFNRLANVPVTFTVLTGGGTFGGQTSVTTNTDPDGRALAVLTLGLQEGTSNNLVAATFPGNASFPASFTASGLAAGNAAGTTITGVVLDNSNTPIPGVSVRAVPAAQWVQNPGSVSSLPAVPTNAQGQFTYPAAPVGSVKLLVDGSTASVPGPYPALEYDLNTVSGQTSTVGAPIFLVPLNSKNQLCVSETQGGTLTMGDVPGFSLTVAAGSVTFPGGARQGCLSVTVVHADKVPMSPGFGQQPRFIVTIQPSGALFNPPAPLTIPNVDGLPPRAVTEMYSFDHDLSSFVAIGNGTVSVDGSVIASNPGVGVLKAGWHCGGNPGAIGTVADCPPCTFCAGVLPPNSPPGSVPGSCVPDQSQAGQPCSSTFNNCYSGGTCSGLGGTQPGSCQGGTPLSGVSCNAGGGQLATCQNGICKGQGNQCPSSCNLGNPCIADACANGACSHTANPQCQQACSGLAAGTACAVGGTTGTCDTSGNCQVCGSLPPGTACLAAGVLGACNSNGQCQGPMPNACQGQHNGSSCGQCVVGGACSNGQCIGGTSVTLTSLLALANGQTQVLQGFTDSTSPSSQINFTGNVNQQGCASLVYSWDFGDGQTSSVPNPSHIFLAPGDYPVSLTVSCGTCFSRVATVEVTLVRLRILSIWSNQLGDGNGAVENFAPLGTGSNGSYLFMGANPTGSGSLGAFLKVEPDTTIVTSQVLVQLQPTGQPSAPVIGTNTPLSNDATSVSAPGFGLFGLTTGTYSVVAGLNLNRSGNLDNQILTTFTIPVKIVPQGDYLLYSALFAAAPIGPTISCFILGQYLGISLPSYLPCQATTQFLVTFATQVPPLLLGALPQTVDVTDVGHALYHRVGVTFDSAGIPHFPQYIFPPGSTLSTEILGSSALKALVDAAVCSNKAALAGSNPVSIPLGASSITFHDADLDLEISFGEAALQNVILQVTTQQQAGQTIVTGVSVMSGNLIDIYNFDYSDGFPFAQWAAQVQAGYPSLGFAGKVFGENVQLQGSIAGYTKNLASTCP